MKYLLIYYFIFNNKVSYFLDLSDINLDKNLFEFCYGLEDHSENNEWIIESMYNWDKEFLRFFLIILKNSFYFSNDSAFKNNIPNLLDIFLKLYYKSCNNNYTVIIDNIFVLIFKK